jgi:EAL domain-containing protein (putative c-di-GMP-specific phosphodiesterase class I)
MNDYANEKIALEQHMRQALENHEFSAYFQPQINSQTGQLSGMEALTRWIKPDGEIVPPDTFISLAEETEIILDLGKEILRQSCQFAKYLQANRHASIRVGVNLSSIQFTDKNLLQTISDALSEFKLNPEQLEIEITESIAMTDISYAIDILTQIRNMGIKISMDDFGTGYSSLSYLQKLPLDTLKIDQSFIRPIGPNGENSEIARAIIAMGHSLNLHLIAEGAEHAYHYKILKELGCHEIQGYFFSKPLSSDDFIEYIKKLGD